MNANKILGGLVVAAPMAAFAFFGVSAAPALANVALAGYGHDEVKVCHNGRTIAINAAAVHAHLNHGDTLGECATSEHGNEHGNEHENTSEQSNENTHSNGGEHDNNHSDN